MHSNQLSDYELADVLGMGTVGTIYRATEKSTGRGVALKKLHAKVNDNTLIRARFKREMMILERLRHPNIVAHLADGRDDETLFYVMEIVSGGTVDDLLERGPLHWSAVVEITRQVCSALQCVHNHGIVHRDLKPSNLFLTPEGDVKLGDFGIARDTIAGDLTKGTVTVGTHAYMAPEQITGDRSMSGKADLYALGCCMFEMLAARKVYVADSYTQLFDKHLTATPPSVRDFADCPESLEKVITQLLSKSAEDRPFNARQVQAQMLEIAEEHSSSDDKQDPAVHVFPEGRLELVERIKRRMMIQTGEVSSTRLAFAVAIIAAAVGVLVAIAKLRG